MLTAHDYYRDERIIRRMLEYCGVPEDISRRFHLGEGVVGAIHPWDLHGRWDIVACTEHMSAEYLVGSGVTLIRDRDREFEAVKKYTFGWLLDMTLDVFRSLWDRRNCLGIIDVEYFSKVNPALSYSDPEYIYAKLEPFHHCMLQTFFDVGINPLVLTTGQGYHYVFQVDNASPVAGLLEHIGHVEASVAWKYDHPGDTRDRIVTMAEGRRWDAMGKLVEFLVHETIKRVPYAGVEIPVTIGDIAVGNPRREAINIDLSCYANPLFMRDIRMAFSTHQKHKMAPHKVGWDIARNVPVQLCIPRYTPCNGNHLSLGEVFRNRRHFDNSANYAGAISTIIPENSSGVLRLIEIYRQSALAAFHHDFDRAFQHDGDDWPRTYDRFDLREVPPCVAHALRNPNPHLLQPTQLQTLVRTLCSRGWWHPKHVAGLIRSKYERNFQWEIDWSKYDAAMWANVWTRFYAGLLVDGADGLLDFNCRSHQEKGNAWAHIPYCVNPSCGYDLRNYSGM